MPVRRFTRDDGTLQIELLDITGDTVPEVTAFLRHLAARDYSPNTLIAYAHDLQHLWRFLATQGLQYPQYTTSLSQPSLEYVTITHPHHPLNGQRCEVVRIRRGVDPDLIIRLADGSHAAIAMSSTDYGETAGPPVAPSGPDLPRLDLQGLRQIVLLVDQLRQDGRLPKPRRRTRRSSAARPGRRGNP